MSRKRIMSMARLTGTSGRSTAPGLPLVYFAIAFASTSSTLQHTTAVSGLQQGSVLTRGRSHSPTSRQRRHHASVLVDFPPVPSPFEPTPASEWEGPQGEAGSLQALCSIVKRACELMAPMVAAKYDSVNLCEVGDDDCGKKVKEGCESAFSIADGMVQYLLTHHLFGCTRIKLRGIVGEEDCHVDLSSRPFKVDDLLVPEEFCDLIELTRDEIVALSEYLKDSEDAYHDLTVFIDPIDGTREFIANNGEECTICIGFADGSGHPVAGVVYRPITNPPTWAAGAKGEGYAASELLRSTPEDTDGNASSHLVTSRLGISPFIVELMEELGWSRLACGGAGNKALMLLEGRNLAHIQDRGLSRWDTCASQAVLEAHGGMLCKLTPFLDAGEERSYTYLKSDTNLDFEPGRAYLSMYNSSPNCGFGKASPDRLAQNVDEVRPYSNLGGLIALNARLNNPRDKAVILAAAREAAKISPPSYN